MKIESKSQKKTHGYGERFMIYVIKIPKMKRERMGQEEYLKKEYLRIFLDQCKILL